MGISPVMIFHQYQFPWIHVRFFPICIIPLQKEIILVRIKQNIAEKF